MVKTLWSFGHSESIRVKILFAKQFHLSRTLSSLLLPIKSSVQIVFTEKCEILLFTVFGQKWWQFLHTLHLKFYYFVNS